MLRPKKPTPAPEPETDLDENLSEDTNHLMRILVGEIVAEQKKTVAVLHRIRGHLVFYTLMIILGMIWGFFVGAFIGSTYY
jgi:hypothetical protein